MALGIDYLWWFTPTRPELRTNYYERTWPKREVKRMYKLDSFSMEEEDTDPDKKYFAVEQRKSQFEKKLFWLLAGLLVLIFIFILQDILLEQGLAKWGWAYTEKPKNVLPESQRK